MYAQIPRSLELPTPTPPPPPLLLSLSVPAHRLARKINARGKKWPEKPKAK